MELPCILRSIGVFSCIISAVSMTRAQWEPDQRLTFNDSLSSLNINNAWCIANGAAGDVHVVWFDKRDGNFEIYYKHSPDNGLTWSADLRLSYTADSSIYPAVACAGSFIHVLWIETASRDIHYRRSLDHGASWGPDTALGLYVPYSNNACIAASGRFVAIAWTYVSNQIGCICSSTAGSAWSSPTFLQALDFPSVAVQDSEVFVVRNNPSRTILLFNRSTDCGTTWEPIVTIAGGNDVRTPSIEVRDSIIHVVWRDLRGSWTVLYARSTDRGYSWSTDTILGRGIYPSITGVKDKVHVIWDRNSPSGLLYRYSTNNGQTWSAETVLTIPAGGAFPYPSIDCWDSLVNIVWHDARNGNWEIYYKRKPTSATVINESQNTDIPQIFTITPSIISHSIHIVAKRPAVNPVKLKVFDIKGRRVWQGMINIKGRDAFVDNQRIAGLPAGVYFVLWDGMKNMPQVKIIKVR